MELIPAMQVVPRMISTNDQISHPRSLSQPRIRTVQVLLVAIWLVAIWAFVALTPSASAKCVSMSFQPLVSVPAMAPSAVVAMPAAAGSLAAGKTATSASPVSIVGLWNVTFLSAGQVIDYGFDLWHADGTELLNDITNPIEGNVCVGVWEKTGARNYKLKHVTWNFDGAGNLTGSGVFLERIKLSADGNTYTGTTVSTFYDLSGNQVGQFAGTMEATRIMPD